MAQLDRFLSALTEYRAEALVLEQDASPAFRFLSGTKSVSKQTLTADRLLGLMRELAPPEAVDEYDREGTASFVYNLGQVTYTGVLEQDEGKLVATIWEATQALASEEPEEMDVPDASGVIAAVQMPAPDGAQDTAPPPPPADAVEPATPARRADDPQPAIPADVETLEIHLPSLDDTDTRDIIPDDLPANYRSQMDELLREMVEREASDLHLCCNHVPMLRHDGSMQELEGRERLQAEDLYRMLFSITPRRHREQFLKSHDTDFAYAIEGVSRYRVNLFFDRNGPGAVFRAIPDHIIPADELGLPDSVKELAMMNKGLVLVTGPTGSGKSTTLAAILDIVNARREDHIITIEDPVEFVHPTKKCLVNQREVGLHTSSFKTALRAALREDPDVVLVGELRDLETVEMAIETAETGHLVFGTLHTTSAPSTVDRIIDQFPADRQDQIRVMLSESLRAVISQSLCKRIGGGRVAALELLFVNHSVSNMIREGKTFQLDSTIQTGRKHGMQTLNDHLTELVEKKVIEASEAYMKSVNKQGLREAFERKGIALDL